MDSARALICRSPTDRLLAHEGTRPQRTTLSTRVGGSSRGRSRTIGTNARGSRCSRAPAPRPTSPTPNRSARSSADDAGTNRPHMLVRSLPATGIPGSRPGARWPATRSARRRFSGNRPILGGRPRGRRNGDPTTSRRSRTPCCRRDRRRARCVCTTSKTRSVATPDVFFGHATHKPPSGSSARAIVGKRRANSARRVTKNTIDVDITARLVSDLHAVGEPTERAIEAVRRGQHGDATARLDTELPRQRGARVPTGGRHSAARSPRPPVHGVTSPRPRGCQPVPLGVAASSGAFPDPFTRISGFRWVTCERHTRSNKEADRCRSDWATKPRTSPPRPPRAPSICTTTSATAGGCCSRTRRTSPRCARPSSVRSPSARASSTSAT